MKNPMEFKVYKKYLRDGRAPIPKNPTVSRVMSANRSKNTGPELLIRKELSSRGIKGYRIHNKNVPGKPDVAFVSKKKAIFINGCFWHRCPECNLPLPKSNLDFWRAKFRKNRARDKKRVWELQKKGWKVLTIWECDMEKRYSRTVARLVKFVN